LVHRSYCKAENLSATKSRTPDVHTTITLLGRYAHGVCTSRPLCDPLVHVAPGGMTGPLNWAGVHRIRHARLAGPNPQSLTTLTPWTRMRPHLGQKPICTHGTRWIPLKTSSPSVVARSAPQTRQMILIKLFTRTLQDADDVAGFTGRCE